MGAEISQPEESQSQPQPQPRLRSRPQPQPQPEQSQLLPQPEQSQSQPQPQPRPRLQPQLRPRPQPQPQPQPQPRTRLRPQLQPRPQPESHERTSSEAILALSPQREETPPSWNRAKAVESAKPSGTQYPTTFVSEKPLKKQLSFPQNYEDILKDADSPIDKSSKEKLHDQLCSGVFLDHKTKKYWVNKNSNTNSFMLYARALSITWAENQNYWRWVPLEESSGTMIEAAELKAVCWLEVHGRFDTRKLSPGILYEVSFLIMLKDPAEGWEVPVNFRLTLPGGKKQEHKEHLWEKLRVRWIEIPVGQFVASAQDSGEMEVSMYEYEGGNWKQGLVIKGVSIKPKSDNYKIGL